MYNKKRKSYTNIITEKKRSGFEVVICDGVTCIIKLKNNVRTKEKRDGSKRY